MDVKSFCMAWVQHHQIELALRDQPLTAIEAFSEASLLPSIAKRADQLATLTLGYGIGLILEDTKESTLGVKVAFDDLTPNLIRLACVLQVLENLKQSATNDSGKVALDELFYD